MLKMPARAAVKILIVFVIILILAFLSLACIDNNNNVNAKSIADKNARKLMAKHNLHPAGEPKLIKADKKLLDKLLKDKRYDHFFEFESDASKDIGIDQNSVKGKPLDKLVYTLKESSQDFKGPIEAHFIFDSTGEIRGAFLCLQYYMPGVVSLRDRYHFYPEKLKEDKLSFGKIEKIVLAGPWGERAWEKTVTVDKPDEVADIVKLLERCAARKGGHPGPTIDGERYGLWLHYESGPVIRAELFTVNSIDALRVDIIRKRHYSPPQELKSHIISLLQR